MAIEAGNEARWKDIEPVHVPPSKEK